MNRRPAAVPRGFSCAPGGGFLRVCVVSAAALCAGCLSAVGPGGRAPSTEILAFEDQGFERTTRIHRPSPMPGGPRPLVVALHGGVSSGEEMEAVTGFSRIADREGFVVAYPDAIGVPLIGVLRAWNDGVCCGQAHTLGISDVDFVTRLLDVLRTRFPIDGRRIYLVGYSNGGALAYRLADEAWRTIAAVGIYASAPEATGTLQSTVFSLRRVQHASLMAIHSIDDPRIAYAGTERWGVVNPPFLATGRFWADALGCRRPVPRQDRGGYLRDGDEECDAGTAVELLSLKGWTHEWAGPANLSAPDAPPALRDFDAAEQMWRFFAAHPKRERREAGPAESHPDRE